MAFIGLTSRAREVALAGREETIDGGARRLRVAVDLSILRHGRSGSARWATGLTDAMRARRDIRLRTWTGRSRRRFRGPLRKLLNAVQDRHFYEIALPAAARGWDADVLLMPVNLSARRSRIPQVVTILDVNFLVEPDTYDPMYRRYATRMFARAAREADVVTTISEFSRGRIAALLGVPIERIHVVYPGLSPAASACLTPPIPGPYALYVGPTEPHKNVGLAIRAWEEPRLTGLPLAVVGRSGRDHHEIRRLAASSGNRVLVVGAVDDAELERWYAGARLFVFPSLTEGFGYPPLEAMQRGIPVVASTGGSLPEVLGDAALYHDPHDVVGLREAAVALIDDGPRRTALVAAGRQRAARYAWSSSAEAMIGMLRLAVGQRG